MTEKAKVAVVIDDMIATLALMDELLKRLGFDVKQTDSGKSGLEVIRNMTMSGSSPTVVFLDWHMPGMSGIDVLKKLKADPATRNVPVIMISAEEQTANLLEAIELGASDYIIKPISEQSLTEKVRRALQK